MLSSTAYDDNSAKVIRIERSYGDNSANDRSTQLLGRQSCSRIHNNSVNTTKKSPKSLQSQFGQKFNRNSARNTYAWLKEVFQSLPSFRGSDAFKQSHEDGLVVNVELDQWLPDRWLEAHPKHRWTIDEIRGEERTQKETAKRNRRRKIEKLKKKPG